MDEAKLLPPFQKNILLDFDWASYIFHWNVCKYVLYRPRIYVGKYVGYTGSEYDLYNLAGCTTVIYVNNLPNG